jgi:hypothetical protein
VTKIHLEQTATALALLGKPITLYDNGSNSIGQVALINAINLARQFGTVRLVWESPYLNIKDELTYRKHISSVVECDVRLHELEKNEFSIHYVERHLNEKGDGIPWALIELICQKHPLRLMHVANTSPPPGSIPG